MPELTYDHLPDIFKKNKEIYHEVDQMVKLYLKNYHIKGRDILDGAKRWVMEEHCLLQAPIEDSSLGGFIWLKSTQYICYLNTWHSRIYQNFVLLHEIYHMISRTGLGGTKLHFIESDLDRDIDERMADYFASLLLLDAGELIRFYTSLSEEHILHKVYLTMDRFLTPYKAVLIRLFELELIEIADLKTYFDLKINFEEEFKKLGLDPSPVQRSLVINFQQIEEMMEQKSDAVPDIANQSNWSILTDIKQYFEQQNEKGTGI